ncbi:DUF1289 domain-containing protein [Fluviibacter phosphoraccumulans]|uniref:DUF1289 domain-containing protein n=1 Tax=Fluviibacter phosphoraccumulans TaxID=1751046 RepID=A0A7R6TPW9_9RHOO|nr:DUF1289 domain-containing protein [Fluviibacter phosphoraccumulans]BBU69474.1 hypothetical protein ICHIAU1_17570 [Fluviibacter phosphoraccumulans]BBU71343.1 hypothetical protein ICHIJ1_12620 [Fluviibacter phosphoraccumulans]
MACKIRPEPESPCVNICRMDTANQYCVGCWRTLDEIRQWSTLSSEERAQILSELDARVPV